MNLRMILELMTWLLIFDMACNIWTLSYRHLINYRVEFCWNISIVKGLPV